jgi:hypothetical protein
VWPPYSGGKRGFIRAGLGFSLPAVQPTVGGTTLPRTVAVTGAARGGVALTDLGLELFADLGGNLKGTRALWLDVGARWMFAPAMSRGPDGVRSGVPFFLGPELLFGGFFQLGSSSIDPMTLKPYSVGGASHPMLGLGLDLAYAIAPSFQLEVGLGNLRWVPVSGGSVLSLGAELGATVRF